MDNKTILKLKSIYSEMLFKMSAASEIDDPKQIAYFFIILASDFIASNGVSESEFCAMMQKVIAEYEAY